MFREKGRYILQTMFLLGAMLWLAGCENNLKTVNLITSQDKTPLEVEQNASIYYNDSTRNKFHLVAPSIEDYGGTDPTMVFPQGLHMDFFDDSAHINGHLDADYAINHENAKLLEADKNVRVVNRKGERLTSEQLFWDQNRHTIYTNKFVTIKTAKEILYGNGMVSNEDFTQYKITDLRGTIQMDNPEDPDKK